MTTVARSSKVTPEEAVKALGEGWCKHGPPEMRLWRVDGRPACRACRMLVLTAQYMQIELTGDYARDFPELFSRMPPEIEELVRWQLDDEYQRSYNAKSVRTHRHVLDIKRERCW